MTKEEMCRKCQKRFGHQFDKEKCKNCVGIAFVEMIDKEIEKLDYIRKNADTIARDIAKQIVVIMGGKEENNDLVRESN